MEIFDVQNQCRTPSCLPKIPKAEFGREKSVFSPPFSLFENGGDTEGVKTSEKTIHFRISGINEIVFGFRRT